MQRAVGGRPFTKWGIGIAVDLRIVLFLLIKMIEAFQAEWFSISWEGVFEGTFNLHSIIVLVGGVFILYTAMKEIFHMIVVEDFQTEIKRDASSAKSGGRQDRFHECGIFVRFHPECDRIDGRHWRNPARLAPLVFGSWWLPS